MSMMACVQAFEFQVDSCCIQVAFKFDLKAAIESVNLDEGWFQEVLDSEPKDLALILSDLANSARIPTSIFRNARMGLPSFVNRKWNEFAVLAGPPLLLLQFTDQLL